MLISMTGKCAYESAADLNLLVLVLMKLHHDDLLIPGTTARSRRRLHMEFRNQRLHVEATCVLTSPTGRILFR
jgi:hypothetical protein